MSKLTGLHSIFSQKFNLPSKLISCVNVRQDPREMKMFTTYDDRSGGYRGALDQSSIHGYGVEAYRPAFLGENQWQQQAEDDKARTHLTRISKNLVVRIDWLGRSSDMSTILTCL